MRVHNKVSRCGNAGASTRTDSLMVNALRARARPMPKTIMCRLTLLVLWAALQIYLCASCMAPEGMMGCCWGIRCSVVWWLKRGRISYISRAGIVPVKLLLLL